MKRIIRFAVFGLIGLCLFVTVIGALASRNGSAPTPTVTARPTHAEAPGATDTPPVAVAPSATPASIKEHLEQIGRAVCKDGFIKAEFLSEGIPPTIAYFECQQVDNLTDALIVGAALMRLQEIGAQAFTIDKVDIVRLVMPQQFQFTAPSNLAPLMAPSEGAKRKELARSLETHKDNFTLFVRPYREAWGDYIK